MTKSAIQWMHRNLFSSISNSVLTVVGVPITIFIFYAVGHWVFVVAKWSVIYDSVRFLMIGRIHSTGVWRAWVSAACLSALFGLTLGQFFPISKIYKSAALVPLAAIFTAALLAFHRPDWAGVAGCATAAAGGWILATRVGGVGRIIGLAWLVGLALACAILAPAGTNNWGGLLLSVLVTAISTIFSLPLGILLALGRQSRIVSIRIACIAYIEFIRSVPLLSVIYWAWIIVPLVLPPTYYVISLVRGVAGFVLFYAAFVAEYVRAGLQGVDEGQREAADALGLNAYDKNIQILLPQAIRTVIPALVGNLLDTFNNVPLVFIIGLTDFLQAGQTILANPQFSNAQLQVYTFLFAVYLVIGALVSYTAGRLELSLNVRHR